MVIDRLMEDRANAARWRLGLSWNAIDSIMQRAVRRDLAWDPEYPCSEPRMATKTLRQRG